MEETGGELILQVIYEADRSFEATLLAGAISGLNGAFEISNNVRPGSHLEVGSIRQGSYWIDLIAVIADMAGVWDRRVMLMEFFDQLADTVPLIVAGTFGTTPLAFSRALAAVATPVRRARAVKARIRLNEGNREIVIDRELADRIAKTRLIGIRSFTGSVHRISNDWFFRDFRRHRTLVKIDAPDSVISKFKNGRRYSMRGELSDDNLDALLFVESAERA